VNLQGPGCDNLRKKTCPHPGKKSPHTHDIPTIKNRKKKQKNLRTVGRRQSRHQAPDRGKEEQTIHSGFTNLVTGGGDSPGVMAGSRTVRPELLNGRRHRSACGESAEKKMGE